MLKCSANQLRVCSYQYTYCSTEGCQNPVPPYQLRAVMRVYACPTGHGPPQCEHPPGSCCG